MTKRAPRKTTPRVASPRGPRSARVNGARGSSPAGAAVVAEPDEPVTGALADALGATPAPAPVIEEAPAEATPTTAEIEEIVAEPAGDSQEPDTDDVEETVASADDVVAEKREVADEPEIAKPETIDGDSDVDADDSADLPAGELDPSVFPVDLDGDEAALAAPVPFMVDPKIAVATPQPVIPTSRPEAPPETAGLAVDVRGLRKSFRGRPAVDGVDLGVRRGSFAGFVGPNGAGKTTTLAMITGLLRPDEGTVHITGVDAWRSPREAKQLVGVLPDRLRLFDRLTGAEFLYHAGALRGLKRATILERSADLAAAFGLEHSLDRFVSDYSAGMLKKIAIAAALIHSPRVLVLDEPFESVDPVSASIVIDVLRSYTQAGGTVLLSSHSMTLIERVCDSVSIIVDGAMLASGPLEDVLEGKSLEERFVELAGGEQAVEGMEWLQSFSG